jgi:hypothetical protein
MPFGTEEMLRRGPEAARNPGMVLGRRGLPMASGRKSGGGKRGGRPAPGKESDKPDPGGPYPILFSEGGLNFRVLEVSHPVAFGREILVAAEMRDRDGLDLFVIRPNGTIEDLGLHGMVDLRGRGVDRFVSFRSYSSFRFKLNRVLQHWHRPVIMGVSLFELAGVREGDGIFQRVKGKFNREIEPYEAVNLNSPVIQHFETGMKFGPGYWIFVNGCTRSVARNPVTFTDVVKHAFPNAEPHKRFTVTYRFAAADPAHGRLDPSGSVAVKSVGTTFDVLTSAPF